MRKEAPLRFEAVVAKFSRIVSGLIGRRRVSEQVSPLRAKGAAPLPCFQCRRSADTGYAGRLLRPERG
jgi:hypothetical protein